MLTKSVYDFIGAHRAEINDAINQRLYRHDGKGGRGTIPTPAPVHDDEEMRGWILNDEGLYNWARSEGVDI
jgi:hypothetical protein